MKRYSNLLQPGSASHSAMTRSDFEFPLTVSRTVPNDVVFCGKLITRRTELDPANQAGTKESENPLLFGQDSSGRSNGFVSWLRSPSGRETWCRRSNSNRKRYNGIFGTVKFPLQMELSDIKTRQERREPMPLPNFTAKDDGDGGESCWEIVRPLRRRGTLMSVLAKASFGCIPIV